MLNIYITRHGETDWNKENRIQGWRDSALTDKGIRNAVALGERLNQVDFHAIYSSPSGRAMKTAELICSEKKIPIFPHDELKELNFGDWEGKTKQEIEQKFKQEFFNFWNAPHLYDHKPHNGESLSDLKFRMQQVITKLITENAEGNILIVTHAVAIRAILSFMMNISTENWWVGPFIEGTSLTLVQYDGNSFLIEKIGESIHIS